VNGLSLLDRQGTSLAADMASVRDHQIDPAIASSVRYTLATRQMSFPRLLDDNIDAEKSCTSNKQKHQTPIDK